MVQSRYNGPSPAIAAAGWSIERLTQPTRLFGANGLRTGPDGRVYIAQVGGSQLSAIDVDTGHIETISPMGGAIVAPDDLVFDDAGNMYITEITENRVSMLRPDGTSRVLQGDMPVANPITMHQGRLFAGECRMGARVFELSLDGGAPRLILEDQPMVNAFEVGPDGKLYFPLMGANQICRVSLDGGAVEVVAGDLGVPDSVKFHPDGYIVSTQVASGEVLKIDPRTGAKEVLANLGPGLDNCTFVGKRIFVSSIPGEITEILAPGKVRSLVPRGLQWPLGLAMDTDGTLLIADGVFAYTLVPGQDIEFAGIAFYPGFPGYLRGLVSSGAGEWIVTTGLGHVAKFKPATSESEFLGAGYDQLMGIAIAGSAVVIAEYGTGRVLSLDGGNESVLASGLDGPRGVAVGDDGSVYVAEERAGRIVKLAGGKAEAIADGLGAPHGLAFRGGKLFVVDVEAKALLAVDATTGARATLAEALPVGAPPGIRPKFLGPVGDMAGPMIPFADVEIGADGTIYISGDGEGSVLALKPA